LHRSMISRHQVTDKKRRETHFAIRRAGTVADSLFDRG
jgi:hypothetical protein